MAATLAIPLPPRPVELASFMPSSAPLLSVSERARRLHRQLAWRRARGCDPSYVMELDGTTITTLQTPCGEVKGLGTGASVWDTAIVLARYPTPTPLLTSPSPPLSRRALGNPSFFVSFFVLF
jgi:hypothetical protein